MFRKIQFAIIGASGIAPAHIKAIRNNSEAEVVFIYSRNIKRAEEFAKQYNLTVARTYEEILCNKAVDAVDIVTEPSRHAQLALEAIKSQKHVLIEKPLDYDIGLAREIVKAASSSSAVTSVVSQRRFEPAIRYMKKSLDNRKIGKLYLVEARLMWARTTEYYNKGNGWRSQEGNVLINQAIHWLDIAVWFFGLPVKINSLLSKAKEEIKCYDTAICCLEFPDNILFNLVCSAASNKDESEVFTIYGTKGILNYTDIKYLNKLIHFLKPSKTPFQCQINSFIASIINKRPPEVSVLDGYNALMVAKLCEEAHGK